MTWPVATLMLGLAIFGGSLVGAEFDQDNLWWAVPFTLGLLICVVGPPLVGMLTD